MRFDRKAPGGGVEVKCRLENGKAYLEWRICLEESLGATENPRYLRLRLVDNLGNVAAECVQDFREEEPLESVLFQPNLWQGTKNPCLYELTAEICKEKGEVLDRMCRKQPLRQLELRPVPPDLPGQLFLNGERFESRAVKYSLPDGGFGAESQSRCFRDLQEILRLGANCICVEKGQKLPEAFLELCERLGLLVGEDCGENPPCFLGGENALFSANMRPASLYYRYLARWSKEPFVYIVPDSVKRLPGGNFGVTCYSNSSRVALYSDGIFFELKNGSEEFTFWEIPAKGPCLMLSAEGEGCSTSFSVHKTFTNSSLIGDN